MIEECIKALRELEGCSLKPYYCPGGRKTIGIGHVIQPGESFEDLTELEAENLLIRDILKVKSSLDRLIKVPLKKCQKIALILFIFNVGAGAFQRSTLRQKINMEEYDLVREELLKWTFSRGKKSKGLMKRREFEADIYEGVHKI